MVPRSPKPPRGGLIPVPEVSRYLRDPLNHMAGLLDHAFSGLNPNTLRAYAKAWDDFAAFLGVGSRAEAAARLVGLKKGGEANALVLSYMGDLRARKKLNADGTPGQEGLSASTIKSRIDGLKGIMNRLRIMGLVSWKIEVRGPKVTAYRDTAGPGKEAVVRAVRQLEGLTDPKAIRNLAVVHMVYKLGLRRNEVASLDLEHLELAQDRIWIMGKGREEREKVTVPPNAKTAIEAWLKVRPKVDEKAVFVSLDNATHGTRLSGMTVWRITTGLGLGRPHGVRHTAITEVLNLTKDVRTAQEFSRHKDLGTLVRYDDNRRDRAGQAAKMLDEDV